MASGNRGARRAETHSGAQLREKQPRVYLARTAPSALDSESHSAERRIRQRSDGVRMKRGDRLRLGDAESNGKQNRFRRLGELGDGEKTERRHDDATSFERAIGERGPETRGNVGGIVVAFDQRYVARERAYERATHAERFGLV